MDVLRVEDLRELTHHTGPCVSIYLPAHRAGDETKQDPIRFKNLLRDAATQLEDSGLRSPQVETILAPAEALLKDSFFWAHQSDGLAVLLSNGFTRVWRLPLPFPSLAVAAERFHLKPLLQYLVADGRFYVLAISQNEVRLLEGTRHSVQELHLDTVPESLSEFLAGEEHQRHLQFHTGMPTRVGGRRAAVFHGHGSFEDQTKEWLGRFFRAIDQGLHEILRTRDAPLVLAGVEYLFSIYRDAASTPHLIEGGIPGNPEHQRPEELHREAWALVEPHFRRRLTGAAARYAELAGTGRTANEVKEILPAATHGRVETLFAAVGVQQWGTYDPEEGSVEIHPKHLPGDQDLLDLAAVLALETRAAVYAVPPSDVPDGSPLSAIFRY